MDPTFNSLGIPKPPGETRVVVAMSGGVDSSVVAGLLAGEGYDVLGVTLQLYDHGAALKKRGACCAGQDIQDAKRVAERLGIPHYVLNYQERFRRQVIEDFAASYARGETPIPCVRCNERIKFGDLLVLAREVGADALATGHYARRIMGVNGPDLHRAAEDARDQSYFLFATTREQLAMVRFPLGDLAKDKVRETARALELNVAAKADSQDICFVPQGRYSEVVARLQPTAVRCGEIVDLNGRVLGEHRGIIYFTVGQRKGLGLFGHEDSLFVVRLDPEKHQVVVGPREALRTRTIKLSHVNWLGNGVVSSVSCSAKVRSTRPPTAARITFTEDATAEVELAVGEDAVAPGQACVFYEETGTRVLGGGWIRRAESFRSVA